ncbi:DUF4255 domain-containing protein [Paucibacter sp. APW11]|uniref:DUF4255 domain-containing protein n=1 Tax=Roseateles aquae TaxID=3077235 RepID=A0ABU3P9A3_9BURK|nr:DUF4255 domain-containing protein [Paucibacter sp. APW11]MDT8999140.1 DUF4255 domain-containing protein [Paucibacter sp. APW11]
MALLDLSLVTRCITTLLEKHIPVFPDWPAGNTLTVSAGPPDAVNAANALSFYLYHVREDAHSKSQDWPVPGDAVPQRFKPMGVTLYYVMTPRSNAADSHLRALSDQLLMGLAMKTLRDQPFIDDHTATQSKLGLVTVMPTAMRGRGNRLRIVLQPTASNEAVQYWQAGTQAARLAAYYEVSATLLEPDEPPSRAGRVLMLGVHAFTRGEPRIDESGSQLSYKIPGEPQARKLDVSPAEVPFGGTLTLRGSNLKGDSTGLQVDHRSFAQPLEVDSAWTLQTDGSTLTVRVQKTIGAQALLPGIYGAVVRSTTRKTLPDGSQRDFDSYSNEVPFAIAPQIASVAVAGAILTVSVDGFLIDAIDPSDLLVFAGNSRLTRGNANPPAAGEFFVLPGSPSLRLRFSSTLSAGSIVPLRLVVRGAESPPLWESVP